MWIRSKWWGVKLLAVVAMLAVDPESAIGSAIITNGTVTLGINDHGQLNVVGGPASGGVTGLFFNATGNEATAPGCLCEGWGVAVASLGVAGSANENFGPPVNLSLVLFASTASTAVSVVTMNGAGGAPLLQITHDYQPSASPNLYEVSVTIQNVSGAALGAGATDLRYRRVMDWDVEPTPFAEFVTIGGLPAGNVLFTSNNGFSEASPLALG